MNAQNWGLVDQLQEAIEQIDGVTSAKIVMDDHNDVAEVHLVGASSRPPKQIVRDTESLLFAQFGMRIDYRKVSLVQLGANTHSTRPRLRLLVAEVEGEGVHVILSSGNRRYEGKVARASASDTDCACATSEATLAALRQAVGDAMSLTLAQSQIIMADNQAVCLVVVLVAHQGDSERLSGTSIVTGSVPMSAAKATLDAVNRRLSVWLNKQEAKSPDKVR